MDILGAFFEYFISVNSQLFGVGFCAWRGLPIVFKISEIVQMQAVRQNFENPCFHDRVDTILGVGSKSRDMDLQSCDIGLFMLWGKIDYLCFLLY